jgi:penicillin amidase
MNRAGNWEEFRDAADGFALPGQNFTYADNEGNVGKLIAAHLPKRQHKPLHTLLSSVASQADWSEIGSTKDMPQVYQPAEGFIASANDEPPDCGFPLGFFYSSSDRIRRIRSVISKTPKITVELLAGLQRDVGLKPALAFRDLLLERLDTVPVESKTGRALAILRDWDGSYAAESAGALIFQIIQVHLLHAFHPTAERVAFTSVWHTRELMESTFRTADHTMATAAAVRGLHRAARELRRHKSWGRIHRIRLRHPLAVLPLIGKQLQFAEWGVGGNEDTVMKTGVPNSYGVHGASYGSMARHISDLTHADENFFTLLGGQDGWINSENALDQVRHWRAGTSIKVPFLIESVRAAFLHQTVLKPS